MPSTNFPQGLSTTTSVHTVSGHIVSTTASLGSVTVTGNIIGQAQHVYYTFGAASTAETAYLTVPFTGDIVETYVTIGATSAVAAAYTVRIGSAGTVAVASVSNTITLNGAQEALATTQTSVTTANGITVTRGVQGTAGSTTISVGIRRTS